MLHSKIAINSELSSMFNEVNIYHDPLYANVKMYALYINGLYC